MSILKKCLLTAISYIFLYSPAIAQFQQWAKEYNGLANNYDDPVGIALDANGNIYIAGTIFDSTGTTMDFVTIKYDSNGVQKWVAEYDTGGYTNTATAIAVDANGNSYITGYTNDIGLNRDYTTVMYNAYGVRQWVAFYNGSGNSQDVATSIGIDMNGNVYVTGNSVALNGDFDYTTVKYNSSGQQQWVMEYNGSGNGADYVSDMKVDANGNCYITGQVLGQIGGSNIATVKYDASGTQQWAKEFNGQSDSLDVSTAIGLDPMGNVFVTGYTLTPTEGSNFVTIKYDINGNQKWTIEYNGDANKEDNPNAIAVDVNGNCCVTGRSTEINGYLNFATVKYNSNGIKQWEKGYTGSPDSLAIEEATKIVMDISGNSYVTGYTFQPTGNYDYTTLKYDANGVQQWVTTYNGQNNNSDFAIDIVVDPSGSVYVGGSTSNANGGDFATVKYNNTGLMIGETLNSSEFVVYPNPNNGLFSIDVTVMKKNEQILISFFDVTGQRVIEISETVSEGLYHKEMDLKEISSGMYFLTIRAGNETIQRKIVKQ